MKSINPTKTNSWIELEKHFYKMKNKHLRGLFLDDANRIKDFQIKVDGFIFDFSKNKIDKNSLKTLIKLAEECDLLDSIQKMFSGKKINKTEDRAVLHTALRDFSSSEILVDGENILPKIKSVRGKMKSFSEGIINGETRGFSGKKITDIVNVGIGGSDLGPNMVVEALKYYKNHLNIHFVSNVDGSHIVEVLRNLNPETTLFIIASKTFTTQETMTNAHFARDWFLKSSKDERFVEKHFVALSTNEKAVIDFGINKDNIFEFWDWVGGRFSLWSAIGLPICLAVGYDNFEKLLKGAHDMDIHFKNESFDKNIPVIMALLGIWYNNFFGSETHAVLPYSQYLHKFTAYLQQVDMESSGKSVDRNSDKINYQTGQIIWGQAGTNGQHAFYQLIHQGTKMITSDFIAFRTPLNKSKSHHTKLLANFLAQTKALAFGKTELDVVKELKKQNKSDEEIDFIKNFKIFEGNICSNSILIEKLTPQNLGKLIAMYEHKIFVQGVIWNIFSFDQWGVELGKQLAGGVLDEMKVGDSMEDLLRL